jgi:hypothetical protein
MVSPSLEEIDAYLRNMRPADRAELHNFIAANPFLDPTAFVDFSAYTAQGTPAQNAQAANARRHLQLRRQAEAAAALNANSAPPPVPAPAGTPPPTYQEAPATPDEPSSQAKKRGRGAAKKNDSPTPIRRRKPCHQCLRKFCANTHNGDCHEKSGRSARCNECGSHPCDEA